MSQNIDPDFKIANAIAYGWEGGKARAFAALRPYVRHLAECTVSESGTPTDDRCSCGLRLAWRIWEIPE